MSNAYLGRFTIRLHAKRNGLLFRFTTDCNFIYFLYSVRFLTGVNSSHPLPGIKVLNCLSTSSCLNYKSATSSGRCIRIELSKAVAHEIRDMSSLSNHLKSLIAISSVPGNLLVLTKPASDPASRSVKKVTNCLPYTGKMSLSVPQRNLNPGLQF